MENASSNSPAAHPPAEINLLSPKDWPELAPLSLRLVIMSRSRPRAINSHRLFPTATLVVPESELTDYAHVALEKVTIPDDVTGVSAVRNWILRRFHGPLETVPWQSKRADTLTRHIENDALMDEAQDPFAGAEVIYAYTRKDALADGVQIDVSEVAREAGLKFPVYLTRAVWESYVTVPDGVQCQDERGRLFDVVWMLRVAARRTSGSEMLFRLHVRNDNRDRTPPLVTLKAVCGPRDIDDPAPVITVLMCDED